MKFGLITDELIAAYHQADAISHSKIQSFDDNFPLHFNQKYVVKIMAPEPKKHFDIGNAAECLISHGETKYLADYPIHPSTYIGKDKQKRDVVKPWNWNAAYCSDWDRFTEGTTIISPDDDRLIRRMREAVMRNPDARALIEASTPQVTFRSKGTNVAVQCRSDFWCPAGVKLPSDGTETGPVDCDLKTIESLAPSAFIGFEKQALDLRYHHAACWYRSVIRRVLAEIAGVAEETLPFVKRYFIVVDKKEWPSCTVYTLPDILLEAAERALFSEEPQGIVPRLLACYAKNEWPDAPVRREVALSPWQLRRELGDERPIW